MLKIPITILIYFIFILFITNCKSKVIYLYDYCEVMEVRLQKESKTIEPRATREAIAFNNELRKDCL